MAVVCVLSQRGGHLSAGNQYNHLHPPPLFHLTANNTTTTPTLRAGEWMHDHYITVCFALDLFWT